MGFTYSPFGRAKAGEQALKYHGKYLVDKRPPTFQNFEFTYLKGQHKDGDGQVGPHKLGLDRKHNLLLCYADMATYKGCPLGKDCELRHEDLSNEELAIIAKTEVGREWIKHVYMKYNETVDEKIKGGGGFPKAAEPSDDPAVQKALEEWKAKHIETLLSDRNPQWGRKAVAALYPDVALPPAAPQQGYRGHRGQQGRRRATNPTSGSQPRPERPFGPVAQAFSQGVQKSTRRHVRDLQSRPRSNSKAWERVSGFSLDD